MNMDEVKVEEGFKICSKCGRILPLSEFYRNKRAKDGLKSHCKQCNKEYQAEWSTNHKENVKAKNAKWRSKNPTYDAQYQQAHKDKIAEYQAEWRNLNKEKIAEYQAEWRNLNKEKIAEYQAEWYNPQTHPLNWAKTIVNNYNKMDRERGFDPNQTISAEWFLQNIAYRPCAHCGLQGIGLIGCNRLDNTKGHTIDNVEPCCLKCNARENIRDQIARGLHWTCKHKKQSFKEFVNEHKKD